MSQDLPIPVTYRFTNFFSVMDKEFTDIETKRLELVKKYGQDNDGTITVSEDNKEKFLKKFEEILDKEIELDWELLSVEKLGTKATLTVRELSSISFLFSEFAKEEIDEPVTV
jgi:hypothetical protein